MALAIASPKITDSQLAKLQSSGVPVVLMSASYEGANRTRRLGSWGTSNAGPNSSFSGSLSTLRNRSHQFIRNHPLAQNAIDTYVANLIGTGIHPRWRLTDKDKREELQALWMRFTDESDADGLTDFYGQLATGARCILESGEVLIRKRVRRPGDGLIVPLQLQILEPDHLPVTMSEVRNGNEINMGIEFNSLGKRSAYHVYRRHPGDSLVGSGTDISTTRIAADNIIHAFRPLRPGQIRGIPWLSTVLVRLYELDSYNDAELVRKKTAAMFAGFIKSPATDTAPETGIDLGTDSLGRGISGLEPGTLQYLDAGEEITFASPADVGQNTLTWIHQQLREIAMGIGVTYEQLTGDLSNVNFSSLRAGLVEFRRRCEMLQWQIIIFQICRPVARWFLDAAVMGGAIDLPGYWTGRRAEYLDIEWRTAGWEYINPVDDRLAEQMDMRNGTDSRQGIIAKRGRDAEVVDMEISEDNTRADEMGLVYDSDPRHTSRSGVIQAAEKARIDKAISGNEGGNQ